MLAHCWNNGGALKDKRITIRLDSKLLDDFLQSMKVMQDEDMSKVVRTLMNKYISSSKPKLDNTAVVSEYQALSFVDAMGGELSDEQRQRLELLRRVRKEIVEEKKDNG